MRIGKQVTYYLKGTQAPATVTAVSGTGASGKKTLNLSFDGGTATAAPHGDDRVEGEGFWLLESEKDEAPSTTRTPVARRKAAE
jgi:hypothetical protein